jgi:alpha-beta hydrolase superfamily lysophospholipase
MPRVALLAATLALVAACSAGGSSRPAVEAAATTAPAPAAPATTGSPGTAAGGGTAPAGDAFYTPPTPLPAGRPGDVIWSRPFTGPSGSQGWEVLYRSTAVDGTPVAVSGVVIAPATTAAPAPAEGRTVLSWAHGTTGMGDACAPSKQYAEGRASEALLAQLAVARGFVYAATDYQGLGPPGDHPYVVGQSEGRNVLDAARAAERLTGTGAGSTSKVLLWGHSQGGGAALFAAELTPTYSPDLQVLGAIAGAPAAELATVAAANDGGPYAGFSLMALVGFHAAYPSLSYDAVLNDAGKTAVAAVDDECSDEILQSYAGRHLADFVVADPATVPGWSDAYAANEPGHTATSVPIFLYQGEADQIIPVGVSATLLKDYCALGVPVSRKTYPGADHTSVIPAAVVDILAFANDRLAGKPAPVGCTGVGE